MFCEPAAPVAAGAPATHHQHGHDGAGHATHAASAQCPFAQSAAPALPAIVALPPAPPRLAHTGAARRDEPRFDTVPLRYAGPLPAGIAPQLQLNARIEGRESGGNADVENSGASFVFLSPGLGFRISRNVDGFAFVQVPVYRKVNGLQLEPRVLGSVGLRYRF